MAAHFDNELPNFTYNNGQEIDFSYKINKSLIKQSKGSLKCVVCGDNALGKINSLLSLFLAVFYSF